MTENAKVVTATPLQAVGFKEPTIIFAELRRSATKSPVLLCLYHPRLKAGGAIILMQAVIKNPKKTVEELVTVMTGLTGAKPSEFQAKLIGNEANLSALRPVLTELGLNVAGELKDEETGELHAYFYTDSGRLRVGPAAAQTHAHPQAHTEAAHIQHHPEPAVHGGKTRVLIVDDSKTIRQLLTMLIGGDPDLEVVGAAELPSQAERMIEELKPDVITLDIHMPEMSGVDLLQRYLPKHPIPTVMISSISMEEGNEVLRALELGAVDYIQKPSFEELDRIAPVIVEKVRTAARVRVRGQAGVTLPHSQRLVASNINQSILIAIGASTGGTEALRNVFTRLPDQIPPIVVVQHIPPVFSRAFANRMAELCPFEVKEAADNDIVQPNRILIAPGGLQMGIEPHNGGYRVKIVDAPPVNRHKPSVDFLFDTVAKYSGKKTVGVILTGMGRDGAQGLLKLRQAGARTIAQDEASSVVFGMPKEAIKIGAAELIKPLGEVAEAMMSLVQKK